MDSSFLQDRIDATKAMIVAYEEAVMSLVAGTIQQYTIDTGQTRQVVTKLDIGVLEKTLDSLYNRCAVLDVRLNGGGSVTVRPAW